MNLLGPAALKQFEEEMVDRMYEIRSGAVRNLIGRGKAENKATAMLLLLEAKACRIITAQKEQWRALSSVWIRRLGYKSRRGYQPRLCRAAESRMGYSRSICRNELCDRSAVNARQWLVALTRCTTPEPA